MMTLQAILSSAQRARRARIWSVELRGGAHDRQQLAVRDAINAGGGWGPEELRARFLGLYIACVEARKQRRQKPVEKDAA